MEDQKALKTRALVSQLTDTVQNEVNDFPANGVMTTSIVVGSILFAGDKLLWVEQLTVQTRSNLV